MKLRLTQQERIMPVQVSANVLYKTATAVVVLLLMMSVAI
jgi:hypothetical protein